MLVVDDEAGIRETFVSILLAEGHEAGAAGSVDEALGVLVRDETDVIIVDISMPERSGLELLAAAQTLAPGAKVLLVTGFPSIDSAAEAVRQGAFEYLTKPVSRSALLRSVRAALSVKALEDEARGYRHHLESLVVERTRQLHDWEHRMREVVDQVRGLGTPAGLEELAPQVLSTLARATAAQAGSFYLRRGNALRLVAALEAPHASPWIPLPARPGSVVARLLADPRPVLVEDVTREPDISSPGGGPYRDGSFLGLPCRGEKGQVEALVFLYNRRGGIFQEQDLAIGQIIAALAEESMRTARLADALNDLQARGRVVQPQLLLEQAEQIFRTVRHEVGNALNTLRITLGVLRANVTTFDERRREEYFARCFESFRLAEQMLRALRAFQQVDEVQPVILDLCSFVTAKEGFVFSAARAGGVECKLHLERDAIVVHADPDATLRALLNLVDNAQAATAHQPSPRIAVSLTTAADRAVMRVVDNGCGIPPEQLDRVMEPLFSTKPSGTGMGLAIVQRLMLKMGGSAAITSHQKEGTTVELSLPLAANAGEPGAPAEASAPAGEAP